MSEVLTYKFSKVATEWLSNSSIAGTVAEKLTNTGEPESRTFENGDNNKKENIKHTPQLTDYVYDLWYNGGQPLVNARNQAAGDIVYIITSNDNIARDHTKPVKGEFGNMHPNTAKYLAGIKWAKPDEIKAFQEALIREWNGNTNPNMTPDEFKRRMARIESVLPAYIKSKNGLMSRGDVLAGHILGPMTITDYLNILRILPEKAAPFAKAMESSLTPIITNFTFGTYQDTFRNRPEIAKAYIDQARMDKVRSTIGGYIQGAITNQDTSKWDPITLLLHAAAYNNDPDYADASNKDVSNIARGIVGDNTTFNDLQGTVDNFNNISIDEKKITDAVDTLMKSNRPEDRKTALMLLAYMKGNTNPDFDAMKANMMSGMKGSAKEGLFQGIKDKGLIWKDLRGAVVFSHRNNPGSVYPWLGNLAQNRVAFWGTLVGGGALAVGGLSLLVSSFLNSQKDEEEEEDEPTSEAGNDPQRQRKPYIPNTTSMWRAGTNA